MCCWAAVLKQCGFKLSSCVERGALCAFNELKTFLEHCAARLMSEWERCLMRKLGMEVVIKVRC